MLAVVQRVKYAKVEVENKVVAEIGGGLMILLGVVQEDCDRDAKILADKIAGLRIFTDENGKMNLSVGDIGGELLAVSQFTLAADCSHGRRPSFFAAAAPDEGELHYRAFIGYLSKSSGKPVKTGIFGSHMEVSLLNDGPVTIILDSNKLK